MTGKYSNTELYPQCRPWGLGSRILVKYLKLFQLFQLKYYSHLIDLVVQMIQKCLKDLQKYLTREEINGVFILIHARQ